MLLKKIFLSLLTYSLILCEAHAEDKLIFAADIIRHGDRTPTTSIPNAPYEWPQGLGQLTAQGMQQEYLLGLQMHKRYIEQSHLLPEHYLAPSMYVRSSDLNRTLMSAESLLLGLYPLGSGPYLSANGEAALPANYQPIAINTVPKEEESLLLPDAKPKEFHALLKKYVYTQNIWQQKNASLKNKLAEWQKITGYPLKKLDNVILLGDDLFVRRTHHVAMPAGLSEATIDEIIATGNWAIVNKFKPHEVGEKLSQKLLVTITNDLNAATHSNELKYALFSSHDITILSMMSALANPLDTPPHYASDLNFSLYQNAAKNYYVKITYNDTPVRIPHCEINCPLTKFNEFVKKQR